MKLKIYFCALAVAFIVLSITVLTTSMETSIVRTHAEEYLEKSQEKWNIIEYDKWLIVTPGMQIAKAEYYLNLAIYYQNQEIIELLRELK